MNQPPPFAAHHRASDDSWQPLEAHLTGVGDLAAGFASKLGLQDIGSLFGLLHDRGKYSPVSHEPAQHLGWMRTATARVGKTGFWDNYSAVEI